MQTRPNIVRAGLQLVARGAILKARFAARHIAVGVGATDQQKHKNRCHPADLNFHAGTSGWGFFK
jgi:hypothetical protein